MMSQQPEKREFFDVSRRHFLHQSAAAAGTVIGSGLILYTLAQAKQPDEAVSAKGRWGMLIDTTKCGEGCENCVNACKTEHGLQGFGRSTTDAQWIRKVQVRDKQTGKVVNLPMLCQHCQHPPCVDVCPTGASFRRPDGIVLVDRHICIGCRYCMMACPYKARSFVHESLETQKERTPRGKGTVEACNFCVYRIDNGQLPACVEACQKTGHGAMFFGDLKDPNSDISRRLATESSTQLRVDMGLNPGIRYQGL